MEKDFSTTRLNTVKDFFLFCCLTGLSYIDVKTLCPAHLYKDNEGKLWIHKARVKITTHKESCTCNVPLLGPALVILKKYKDWDPENPEGPCFPIPSNQKMNEFLKEIATLCRVNKRLTVHVARHTFATTVTLGQRCRPAECVEDARPFFNLHDTALCPCAGQQYHEGHAGCRPSLRIIRKGYTSQRTVRYGLLHNEELFACMDWPRFYRGLSLLHFFNQSDNILSPIIGFPVNLGEG